MQSVFGMDSKLPITTAVLVERKSWLHSNNYKPTVVPGQSSSMSSPGNGLRAVLRFLRSNALTLLTVLSVLLGIGLGFLLRNTTKLPWPSRDLMYLNFTGDLFLRMLKCLILPLIVSSMVSAVGGLDLKLSGKIGSRAVLYYLLTTLLAVILGIALVMTIKPGVGTQKDKMVKEGSSRNITVADTMLDLLRNLFPPNAVEASISQYRTVLIYPGPKVKNGTDTNGTDTANETNVSYEEIPMDEWPLKGEYTSGTNILGLVMFSVVLGIAISKMQTRALPLLNFFLAFSETVMLITHWVIWLSPVGILFLVATKIVEMKDFGVLAGQLGLYTLTVLVGLFIHGFIVLPLIYCVCTRQLPFRFVLNMMQALTTAFGTASSSATLPVTIACLEDRNKVDSRVSRFVLPIGATINMDGTALYEAVAALFIAQVRDIELDIGSIIAVSITATAASIGAAGIPQAGLVTMVMVLNAVGLPAEDVTLIIVVDWFLDRFRTMVNVLGDSFGAGIVDHLSHKDLLIPEPDDKRDLETGLKKTATMANGNAGLHEELESQTTSM